MPILYIKLGQNDEWAAHCIQSNTIRLGYATHKPEVLKWCQEKNWDAIEAYWVNREIETGKTQQKATDEAAQKLREIKAFFTAGSDTLWVTFYGDCMYYGPNAHQCGSPDSARNTRLL